MLVGVTKEIKNHEYRVGLTPQGAAELKRRGHSVLVQTQAGAGVGFTDEQYLAAGATISANAERVFAEAEMIVKVKEPQPQECRSLRPGQVLFTYLHLAPDPEQTRLLLESDCVAIAYETVTDERGGLPLLAPMSEVAGRMAVQAGAHALEKAQGGAGVLLPGVPGVPPAKVVVLGGGVVGINAARIAMGIGAQVTILDISLARLKELDAQYGPRLITLYSSHVAICEAIAEADLVIGGVLIPGAAAPKLITREMLKLMKTRFGHRRCGDRPGRLRRDQSCDDASASDLRGRWRGALLRGEHAGRCGAYIDAGADQCDLAVRAATGRQGLSQGARRIETFAQRTQHPPRHGDLRSSGARSGLSIRAPCCINDRPVI